MPSTALITARLARNWFDEMERSTRLWPMSVLESSAAPPVIEAAPAAPGGPSTGRPELGPAA